MGRGFSLIKTLRQRLLFFAITTLGISSIVTQLFITREFLNVFQGNELIFGILLANWLMFTGAGAYAGKLIGRIKNKIPLLVVFQFMIALLPIISITIIRMIKPVVMSSGTPGMAGVFSYSLLILSPYCVISGFLLTLACSVFSEKRTEGQIGKVYLIDNIGDIMGGFLFSFVLVYVLDSFQMALFLMAVIMLSAYLLAFHAGSKKLMLSSVLIVAVVSAFFSSFDLNSITTEMMFPGQEVIHQESSPYGNLVVTKTGRQINFFENGLPLFSTDNTAEAEETVHYAMVQHPDPRRVLLISGGASGTTEEVLKYEVENIDYVELDPTIISAGRKYTRSLDSDKINTHQTDGRLFVKTTREKYDVVIIDLPDPGNAQVNRFYSLEFFRDLMRVMNSGGVISLSISSSPNYMNHETVRMNSIIYHTLGSVFGNVIVIPAGDSNFFVASDSELSYDIPYLVRERGVETRYVNENYLKGTLTEERISYTLDAMKSESPTLNTDFRPLAYYYHILFWETQFRSDLLPVILIAAAALVLIFSRMTPVPFAITTTGFAASSLEVVLLLGFQILYGYVYQYIGIIIAFFMLGLAAGAYFMNRSLHEKTRKDMINIEFSVFLFSISLPVILVILSLFGSHFTTMISSVFVFPLLTLAMASLVGMEFPLASKLHLEKKQIEHTAGVLYASDLLGAMIGALVTSAFLIPVFGIIDTCVLVGVVNLVSGLVVWRKG